MTVYEIITFSSLTLCNSPNKHWFNIGLTLNQKKLMLIMFIDWLIESLLFITIITSIKQSLNSPIS